MKKQIVLITGAAKRLGGAIARSCAEAGMDVILHYHTSEQAAKNLESGLNESGARTWMFRADLSDPKETNSLFRKALDAAGQIDVLINNASIFPKDTLTGFTARALYRNIGVNAFAPLQLGRRFAEQQCKGKIINLLDARITDYDKEHTAYHLSKRMLCDITKMMALEFAPLITVNGVAPGLILPPPGEDSGFLKKMSRTNPLCTHGTAQDVADAVLFLIKAEFITGQVIFIDGGRHLKGCVYGS